MRKTTFLVLATSFVNSSQEQNSSEIKRNSKETEKNEKKRTFSVGKGSPFIKKIDEGERIGAFTNRVQSVRDLNFPDLNILTNNGK